MPALKYCTWSFKTVLTCAFLAMTIRGILKLVSRDVGTRSFVKTGQNFAPAMAICPYLYPPSVEQVFMQLQHNHTFEDVMNLPRIRDHVEIMIDMTIEKPYQNE